MSSLPEMPCGPILELNGQRKRFPVPFGLKPLMDVMIRGVLEDQPENIYEYLACFMEERIIKIEEAEMKNRGKSWEKHRWSWEASSVLPGDDLDEFLQIFTASHEEAVHYATVIQTAFRGHIAREKVKEMRNSIQLDSDEAKNHLATVNQEPFSGHQAREKVKEMDRVRREPEEHDDEEDEENEPETYKDDEENELETDEEDDNYDEEEGEKRSYEDSEEELETEVEISEMENLAGEMEIMAINSPTTLSKFHMADSVSKTKFDQNKDEDEEEEEQQQQQQIVEEE